MLEVEHLKIIGKKDCIILKDATFCLPNQGIISICSDQEELHHALAQVLSGIRKPQSGCIRYNKQCMMMFHEEERSSYRSQFVISLFHNFQILSNQSVFQNITMGLEYPMDRVEQALNHWDLYEKRNILAEDLSTFEQWKMVLLRCQLRQPMMLVFDVASSPLSASELERFYTLLEDLRNHMLIVIIGDRSSYSISNRIIECEQGYIISDSSNEKDVFPQINHNGDTFQLSRTNLEELHHKMHFFMRWKLRCASILCVIAFICLSTAIFSTTLNITDIQLQVMKNQKSSIIAIEKMGVAADGSILRNEYAPLNQGDIKKLNQELSKPLVLGYAPIDILDATYFSYGTIILENAKSDLDGYTIIEADSGEDIGLHNIYGRYPKNYHEIALSSEQAYQLFDNVLSSPYQNSREQAEEILQQRITWFGQELTITGIYPAYASSNNNMDLDMSGYNGHIAQSGTLLENTFLVQKGFSEYYHVFDDQVYQKSYKRMISDSNTITDFSHITTLDKDVYYYDGNDVVAGSTLKKDEIIVDFPMALQLGYRASYLQSVDEQQGVTFKERVENYKDFANQWIDKTVTLQTYDFANSPNDSTIMSKKMKIKGFAIPVTYDYLERYALEEHNGSVYVHKEIAKEYQTSNRYIKEAFFFSNDDQELKQALSYLDKQPGYMAYITDSTPLQFFVVDLKSMNALLMIIGSASFMIYIAILIFLLRSTSIHMRDELSLYYIFGERRSILRKLILNYFKTILSTRTLFGWFCGTLALGTFILMIYFTLSASSTILWSLCLPVALLAICMVVTLCAFYIAMRSIRFIEIEFCDHD